MRISIGIPEKAKLIPNLLTEISYGEPLYTLKTIKPTVIQITKKLNVHTEDIFHVIKVSIQDGVEKDTILAEKKGFLGSKQIRSPHKGKIISISHTEGTIEIESTEDTLDTDDKKTVNSFFNGIIIKQDKDKIILEIEKSKEIEISKIESDFGGNITSIQEESEWFSLNEELVNNSIIVTESITRSQLSKCETLGAIGFIIHTGYDHIKKPYAKVSYKDTFNKIAKHKGYILLSSKDKKALLYK